MQGLANRRVGSTAMNNESSRSHSVFTFVIESRSKVLMTFFLCVDCVKPIPLSALLIFVILFEWSMQEAHNVVGLYAEYCRGREQCKDKQDEPGRFGRI